MQARPDGGGRRRGISLVETLFALTLLSVMLIPMILLLQVGTRSAVSGERRARAALFAHEVLEVVRAEMDGWAADSDLPVSWPRIELKPPQGFRYRYQVEPAEAQLDVLTVEVSWEEKRKSRRLGMAVLVSRRGAVRRPTAVDERIRRW
jgi:Tfp pilus assembly protein PilV